MAAGNQDRWRRNQANRTKDQVEIEILDLGRKQEDLREQSAFVPKGVPWLSRKHLLTLRGCLRAHRLQGSV
ncbi:MAG TPA: hypothetical protein VK626_10450 [Nitrospiraceae bacterium]|jgi:hypothetical protein|nr:hypothetical protein [Nitrospiraceae bacterium]